MSKLDVSPKVKKIVQERDQCCIVCGSHRALTYAHVFVNRSHQGMGVERNIALLCMKCHNDYDNSNKKEKHDYVEKVVKDYMHSIYGDINIADLKLKNKWEV